MKKILTTALLLTLCQHGLAFSLKDTLIEIAKETDDSFYCAAWDINGTDADIKIKRV